MALRHCGVCGAAPAVLCVSAVRERVRGVRFVCSACRSRGKQSASSTSASIFMCASLIDFCSEKNLQPDASGPQRLPHSFIGPLTPALKCESGAPICLGAASP